MLLQLEKTKKADVQKLFEFAKNNNLQLTLVDSDKTKSYLPGKALTSAELKKLISKSRKSGVVSLAKGHQAIRKKMNGN